MIVELAVLPSGVGASVSRYVKEAVKIIKESTGKVHNSPMCTVFEVSTFRQLSEILEKIDKKMEEMGVPREIFHINIDIRRDKKINMEYKLSRIMQQ